jgi:cytosine/uracil/thiamine/allantoin permease
MAASAARNAPPPRYVENRHIDHIPAGARHGEPWHQFAFWFGGNVNVFNVVVGAVTSSTARNHWQIATTRPTARQLRQDQGLAARSGLAR